MFCVPFLTSLVISNAQLEICLNLGLLSEVICNRFTEDGEENVADKSFSRSRRSTTAWAVITHYAPPLEGLWTNPLVVVGEAPCLSQTGYKAYSYSPWAVITLSCIHDANWRLSRFVTHERMTPIGVYRV